MGTYTYVRYFNEISLTRIRAELKHLKDDAERRFPDMSEEAHIALLQRLRIVENGIELLAEPVPKPFGG